LNTSFAVEVAVVVEQASELSFARVVFSSRLHQQQTTPDDTLDLYSDVRNAGGIGGAYLLVFLLQHSSFHPRSWYMYFALCCVRVFFSLVVAPLAATS
jgi:hypothetical protein